VNFVEFAVKLRETQSEIGKFGLANVEEAAKLVEGSVALASGRYRGRPIVATRSNLIPGATPRALVKMTSRKAHLLDRDTRPHGISPRKAAVLSIGNGEFAAHVNHPGTTGKRMWEKGVILAFPKIHHLVTDRFTGAIAKVFH
jgi:hypothetical protein